MDGKIETFEDVEIASVERIATFRALRRAIEEMNKGQGETAAVVFAELRRQKTASRDIGNE